MNRSVRLAAATLALSLLTAACGDGGGGSQPEAAIPEPGPGEGTEVAVKTFIYRPDPLTIEAGTTVTFTNYDEILHTVTAGERGALSGLFDTDIDGAGSTFRFTFRERGTFRYFCKIHNGMEAEIIVR